MRFIKSEYEEMFSCKVGQSMFGGPFSLFTSDGKMYAIEDYSCPWEELWEETKKIMEESVDTGENLLLKKYRDKEYDLGTINLDYDY